MAMHTCANENTLILVYLSFVDIADSCKRISGDLGVSPPKAMRFLLKGPKIDAKTLGHTY